MAAEGMAPAMSGTTEPSMYLYPDGINLYMGKATRMLTRVGHSPTLNTVLMAAGLASCEDTVVFISAYGVFNPGRNWDQVRP